ncbi:MAG TPA: hypothetical protein VD816_15695 [Ohtaekwangia sp.]|nr:hypothetical protein [Ohtaekwangia sp.]
MKSNSKIVVLSIAVTAIVACWLVPGINTARQTRYTRIYEDTGVEAVAVKRDSLPHPVAARPEKKYKKESIEPNARLKDMKVEMFSRALHFDEEVWIDTIIAEQQPIMDTLYGREMSGQDSVHRVR